MSCRHTYPDPYTRVVAINDAGTVHGTRVPQSGTPRGGGVASWPLLAIMFTVSWLLYHNTVINNVYVFGGSPNVLTFSGFLWHADVALHGAPAIDARSFFGQHFSPLLVPFGLASHLFALDHVQWYAVVVGLWHAFTTTVVAWAMQRVACAYDCRPLTTTLLTLGVGLGFALTSLHASFAYLPHPEILIPGLLILALCALAERAYGLASIAAMALFLTREDGGLHLATLSAALALASVLQDRRWSRTWLLLTVLGTAASGFEFWLRPKLTTNSSFSLFGIVYLGDPPLAQVSFGETVERLRSFALESGHIWGPLVVLLLAAVLWRDLRYAAVVLAVLPWMVLHLVIARSASAAMMAGYYAFPIVTALAWPSIVALLARADGPPRPGFVTWLVLQAGVLLAASIPPISLDPLSFGSRALWHRYALVDAAHAAPAYRAFGRALKRGRAELGELATTINASLLAPWVLKHAEWSEDFEARGRDFAALKTFLAFDHPYFNGEPPCDAAEAFSERAALPYRYTVPGTRIIVLSRLDLGQMPSFASLLVPEPQGPLCGTPIREGRDRG